MGGREWQKIKKTFSPSSLNKIHAQRTHNCVLILLYLRQLKK